MSTVFLGGTCGNNTWREEVFIELRARGIDTSGLFNPVVAEWDKEAQANEEHHKANDDFLLFFLSDPEQEDNPLSTYSLVEATMALYDRPDRTVVCFDHEAIEGVHPQKVFGQSEKILRTRFPKATILSSYEELIEWLESVLS